MSEGGSVTTHTGTIDGDTNVQVYAIRPESDQEEDIAAVRNVLSTQGVAFVEVSGMFIVRVDAVTDAGALSDALKGLGIDTGVMSIDSPEGADKREEVSSAVLDFLMGKSRGMVKLSDLTTEIMTQIMKTFQESRSALAENKRSLQQVACDMSVYRYNFERESVDKKYEADKMNAWSDIAGGIAAFSMGIANAIASSLKANHDAKVKVSASDGTADTPQNQNTNNSNDANNATESTQNQQQQGSQQAQDKQVQQIQKNNQQQVQQQDNQQAQEQGDQQVQEQGSQQVQDQQVQEQGDQQVQDQQQAQQSDGQADNKKELEEKLVEKRKTDKTENGENKSAEESKEAKELKMPEKQRNLIDGLDKVVSTALFGLKAAGLNHESGILQNEAKAVESFLAALNQFVSGTGESMSLFTQGIGQYISIVAETLNLSHQSKGQVISNIA
jgi:hypothetical protein